MEVWPAGAAGEDRLCGGAGMTAGWDRLGIPGTAARAVGCEAGGPRQVPGESWLDGRTSLVSDWNTKIIEEFRANGGAVGGQFAGAPLLLLHTVGARSGQRRVNPVMYQKVDRGYAVFASKAGAPVSPGWYHNLLAQPQVTAEIGTQTVELVARVAGGDERDRIWAAQKAAYPGFADYERKTTRQIPVIVLEPARL